MPSKDQGVPATKESLAVFYSGFLQWLVPGALEVRDPQHTPSGMLSVCRSAVMMSGGGSVPGLSPEKTS